jgi:choline kinase
MNAILYVAGRAIRLGELTASTHKVLLEFGGKTLLERHVMILPRLGIQTLYVVTGHSRDKVAAEFPALRRRYNTRIEEIYNPHYAEGSVLSMHASLPALRLATDEILLMDGDVLYDQRVLEKLIRSPHRTVLLIDRQYSTADDDPVIVPVRNGRPFDFVKKWKGEAEYTGESIGFFKVNAADMPLLIRETEASVEGGARLDSYDDVLRVMVQAGLFHAEDVTGLPWTEVDFPQDIEHAETSILPSLQDHVER